jgi:hypothetical protein
MVGSKNKQNLSTERDINMSDIGAALSARGAGSLRAGTNASRLHQLSP